MSEKTTKRILRFGLPKGSLQESTMALMAKAGWKISTGSRSYVPRTDDAELELRLIRAQEISRYVEHGFLDVGLTGADWIAENASDVHVVGEIACDQEDRSDQDREAYRQDGGERADIAEDRARRPPQDAIGIGCERQDGV